MALHKVEQSCVTCMHINNHEAQTLACCQMDRVLNAFSIAKARPRCGEVSMTHDAGIRHVMILNCLHSLNPLAY